ncbi:MAG TPA: DUF4926 domain-containing protein [Candidatus Binatia bacterium]
MKFKEFQQVALAKDIPEERLRRGDLATIVDIYIQEMAERSVTPSRFSMRSAKR